MYLLTNTMNEMTSESAGHAPDPVSRLNEENHLLRQQLADQAVELDQLRQALQNCEEVKLQSQQNADERAELLAQERKLSELKTNFVTLASHEFRTPIGTILMSASLIGRYNGEQDGPKRERHVDRIKSAVADLTALLNEFLALSHIEQRTVPNKPVSLVLPTFCQELIEEMEPVLKPGQSIQYEHTAGDSSIVIDGTMVKNILINLLGNASKYSAEGKEIGLTTTVRNGQVKIDVIDEGIGVPDQDKDKLFNNFFRARNAIHFQGTGLGLYVVKRYVDLLGGTISFTSQLDVGTVFTVNLPLATLPTAA
ncbi:PAS/PAC sensor signal transduction histidine kinase [Fibrisoma limi BUZ 3]|uniref:histidine kinase n=2 Tax=Fibrisoma limi TaxID=663275 RepID=I2GFB5_9BACT|nr:PAS/PAC sensor signal transduction histidine kinase [Fibrisoma limi BUZ 3]